MAGLHGTEVRRSRAEVRATRPASPESSTSSTSSRMRLSGRHPAQLPLASRQYACTAANATARANPSLPSSETDDAIARAAQTHADNAARALAHRHGLFVLCMLGRCGHSSHRAPASPPSPLHPRQCAVGNRRNGHSYSIRHSECPRNTGTDAPAHLPLITLL